jgi:cyclomaltodextrinase
MSLSGESATFATPEWVKDAIFYQIFPDRFARSNRVTRPINLEDWEQPPTQFGFKGGDLLGVVERLDYLQDLGVTAIYFNPIFQSASNHRYHTHDYMQVDPLLGGDQAFRELLDQAHRRGLRVVLDGVFNHASRGFFQFNHILENGAASPYLDWFLVKDFPLNAYMAKPGVHQYASWANLPALPKFNAGNPQVRRFIFDVARYWLEQGIDGWRLDVPDEIKVEGFWHEFRRLVKAVNPEAYIVGEIPWEAPSWLQGDRFDAVMNYPFARACLGFFARGGIDRQLEAGYMGLPPAPELDAAGFAQRVEGLLEMYPRQAVLAQLNLLDSHDTPRFLSLASGRGGGGAALRLATLFQMTYPGAPCIYYGDEVGMLGGRDPDCRRAFLWADGSEEPHPSWDLELRGYYKRCIALRKRHPALRRGDYVSLYAEDGVYAYLRRLHTDSLVVVINNQSAAYDLDVPVGQHLAAGAQLHAVFGEGLAMVKEGRLIGVTIPAYMGYVFCN